MSENCNVDNCEGDGVSALLINEKGRNKRKFLCDLSLDNPVEVSSLTEFPRYEIMEEKIRNALNELGYMMEKSEDSVAEQDMEEFQQSDWDDPVTCQLEELLSNTLFSTFCTAVNKIVECGYTKEVAEWAILHSSMFHGSADAVSNVVESALAILKREKELNTSKHPVFDGLQNLVDYTLLEMIYVLREVWPSMSVSEAMWCLLVSDLNLVNACVAGGAAFSAFSSGEGESSTQFSQSKDINNSSSEKQIIINDKGSQLEAPTPVPCYRSTRKQCPCEFGKENSLFCQEAKEKLAAFIKEHIQAMDEKSVCRGKCSSLSIKRDVLRQKASHFEKYFKGSMLKGVFKAKVTAWGMVLDKSLKSPSSSSMKGAPTKSAGTSSAAVEGSNGASLTGCSVKDGAFALNSKTQESSLLEANCGSKGEVNVSDTRKAIDFYASIPFDETLQKHIPQDDKDEAILVLVPHKQDIEKELQGWTEWANEKVMQAARRLGKDREELRMLRQEKEEMEKFNKEKQTLEESTMKRLSEMESALTNATAQIEVANSNIRRLEEENNMLKSDLEAAKVHALRAAANLHSAVQREQETLKKMQSWDAEKRLIQEQLKNLKCQTPALNTRLENAKQRQDQFKALWNREEKEKLKAQKQIDSSRREVEDVRELMKVEADKIKQAAEKEMQKCEGDIKNLRSMMAELRLESNKSKIAALSMGYLAEPEIRKAAKRLTVFKGTSGDLKPERECVMCMTEEISVVFLPCLHQVLCRQCSALHQKQGMNDCPCCRTSIQSRISVTYRSD